jgi:hypothetical protein
MTWSAMLARLRRPVGRLPPFSQRVGPPRFAWARPALPAPCCIVPSPALTVIEAVPPLNGTATRALCFVEPNCDPSDPCRQSRSRGNNWGLHSYTVIFARYPTGVNGSSCIARKPYAPACRRWATNADGRKIGALAGDRRPSRRPVDAPAGDFQGVRNDFLVVAPWPRPSTPVRVRRSRADRDGQAQ